MKFQHDQRNQVPLDDGDIAYIVHDRSWEAPTKVQILGPCEIGSGYQALVLEATETLGLEKDATIHTCNLTLVEDRETARRLRVEVLREMLASYKQRLAFDQRAVKYVRYLLRRRGRWE